jgi:two-component system sensor histidine kinase VanS
VNRSIFKSVRWKLIIYSFISFLLTFVTEAAAGIIIYLAAVSTGRTGHNNITGPAIMRNSMMDLQKNSETMSFAEKLSILFNIDERLLTVIIFSVFVSGFFFFIIYFMLLSRSITLDLSHIAMKIRGIADGDLKVVLKTERDDEIGDIARSVNEMSAKINELVENERGALKSNKDMITAVAHDLRTPLTSLVGYMELALDEKHTIEERQKYAAIAEDKARVLQKMIEELFDYTKLMSGEVKLHKEEIDIVELLRQMIEEFYPIFEQNGLEFEFNTNAESVHIMADPLLLARVVQNLISNAVKYGKDGKRIIIGFKNLPGKGIYFKVTNFGLVIPEKSLSKVFEKFYRVEDSRSKKTGGTGLGLNIARQVVELHGGTISVASDISGTTFYVSLPESLRADKTPDNEEVMDQTSENIISG